MSFLKSQVRATLLIIVHETLQVTVQAPFAEHDYLVQALAADGADYPSHISPLQGETRYRQQLFDPDGLDLIHKIFSEVPVGGSSTFRRRKRQNATAGAANDSNNEKSAQVPAVQFEDVGGFNHHPHIHVCLHEDLGAGGPLVSQPKRNHRNVDSRLEQVHRR